MNRTRLLIFLTIMAIASIGVGQQPHEKSIYHARKVSPYVVRITCDNGADASVVTDPKLRAVLGDGLLVSCGDMRKPETLRP